MSNSPLRAAARGARRRGLPLLTLLQAALVAVPGTALAEPSYDHSTTFHYQGCGVGSENAWTVPTGVTEVFVLAQGAGGYAPAGADMPAPGRGARLSGTLTVTPGETLYGCVDSGAGQTGIGGIGGGRGGGFSSLSRDADGKTAALVIAGGGGGAGSGGAGGDAGTLTGSGAPGASGQGDGGQGADAAAPGAGGPNALATGTAGSPGVEFVGGAGGQGDEGGGGGGGGRYGGGGGSGAVEDRSAGGGGGSSACALTDCFAVVSGGSGSVTIMWDDPAPIATMTHLGLSTISPTSQQRIFYRATVGPTPDGGSVDFSVDAAPLLDCQDVPVVAGVATCETWAPGPPGSHELKAVYSGTAAYAGSEEASMFSVLDAHITIDPTPTADFGEVTVGESAQRTFTIGNDGTADLVIEEVNGVYVREYEPLASSNNTDFRLIADGCSHRTLAPEESCQVTVAFIPTRAGAQRAQLSVRADVWFGAVPTKLVGVGVAPQPQEREPEQPQERTPETPETPTTPQAPAAPPAAPAPAPTPTPAKPAETSRTPASPPVVGASSPLGVARPAQVRPSGGVRLPLVCPPGQACSVSGTLTLAITGGQARAAATTKTRVLVRFNGVKIAAGTTKTLSLKLPASFVKAQQRKGVRKLRTTLTVRTTLGNGRRATRRQTVTLLIPRARTAQRAAPRPAQRPSFTG